MLESDVLRSRLMSICHLGPMNVLACACICGPVSKRYRSSETDFHYGYIHTQMYIWLLAANKGVFVSLFVCLFVFFLT